MRTYLKKLKKAIDSRAHYNSDSSGRIGDACHTVAVTLCVISELIQAILDPTKEEKSND